MSDIAFEITRWEESSYGEGDALYERRADGPPFARVQMAKRYSGELVADAVGEVQTCGQEGYLATERIAGTLAGRSGTFALQHGATHDAAGEPIQFGWIVADSATGELEGLRGEALISHGELRLTWELPAASGG